MKKSRVLKLASILEIFFYIAAIIFEIMLMLTTWIVSSLQPFAGLRSNVMLWLSEISIGILAILGLSTANKLEKNETYIFNTIINIMYVVVLYFGKFYILTGCLLLIEILKLIGKFNQDKIKIKEENKNEFDREDL